MRKVAYFQIAHCGGTYTVFKLLQEGLKRKGYSLRCVATGSSHRKAMDSVHVDDAVVLCPETDDARSRTQALLDYITSERFDVIIANGTPVETNAMRFMPPSVRRLYIVHNITHGAYAPARAVRDWADLYVAVSPRVKGDMVRRFGFPADSVRTVFHGVDVGSFPESTRVNTGKVVRLLSLGRINDYAKGVMWLPEILERAMGSYSALELDVVGDGPEEDKLARAFARKGLSGKVNLIGRVPRGRVPDLFSSHDIFLMPSRFEGCPTALLEAMATGCVPVVSRIKGVTDEIVCDRASGMLCPIGDVASFAESLVRLAEDRTLLRGLSQRATRRIRERFTLERMADDYDQLLREILNKPYGGATPLEMSDFEMHPLFQATWRTKIPLPLKNFARKWLERVGIQI